MEQNQNLTVSITVRLPQADADMLKAEATRRGFTELAPFVRELILASAALPTTTTFILQAVLSIGQGFHKTLREMVGNDEVTPERIDKIWRDSESAGESLVSGFIYKRIEQARLEGAK